MNGVYIFWESYTSVFQYHVFGFFCENKHLEFSCDSC